MNRPREPLGQGTRVRSVQIERAALDGSFVIDAEPHVDDRGAFVRTFCELEFAAAGLPTRFPQCNLSTNHRAGTLRGMHYNAAPHGESKIVRCVRGSVYDVIVDIRAGSPSRLQWLGMELSASNQRSLFVPAGFAHGFITLADDTDVLYHMGALYRPDAARGFRWNDPAVTIEWPLTPLVMSSSDATYPDLDPAELVG